MSTTQLDGILVADFSRVLAGPLCTQTLSDLGADVIKVERIEGGDDTRQWGPPFVDEGSTYFLGLNRGKRSITLDLHSEADNKLALELCRRADVIVESFRPGTMARLGLGWEQISEINPRAIYSSISAFGSGEKASALPGYELLVQAMSGYMSTTGEPDGPAVRPGTAMIDMTTGLYSTIGILAALQERETSGLGQHLEVSLLDSGLLALLNLGAGFLNTGELPQRAGNAHASIVPYQTFATADGELALAVGNDALFARCCEALGTPELADHADYSTNSARVEHREALVAEMTTIFAAQTAAEWAKRLTAAGVPAGPVNKIDQAYELAEQLGLEPVVELDGVRSARSPMRFSRTPVEPTRRPPRLGEHSDQLRAWLSES
jgi:crotonobetainyl-CoA:carnitine CoA-transferase CaiB-like acyl-CoA transferase